MAFPFLLCIILSFLCFELSGLGTVEARPQPRLYPRQSLSDSDSPCTGFFDSECTLLILNLRRQLTKITDDFFAAEDAYNCLKSAPFDQGTALEFLQYWNETLQLQSTQAYLKNPPPEYQQPPVDLFERLANIQNQVNAGHFSNEYDFEVAVQKLILATHDAHINLGYGVLSIFTFGSPYGLVSVSTDGVALPKLFLTGQRSNMTDSDRH